MLSDNFLIGDDILLRIRGMVRRRPHSGGCFELHVPRLDIQRGERVALIGQSGCGKSTLLDMLALVLRPDESGSFLILPRETKRLDVGKAWRRREMDALSRFRSRHLGYVLQTGGLLPYLTVLENIQLHPDADLEKRRLRIEDLVDSLGLTGHLGKKPHQLSVGQRQRAAIARALAHQPTLILADEPTGSLDPVNANQVMRIFEGLVRELEITLVMATHAGDWAADLGFRILEFELGGAAGDSLVQARLRA